MSSANQRKRNMMVGARVFCVYVCACVCVCVCVNIGGRMEIFKLK